MRPTRVALRTTLERQTFLSSFNAGNGRTMQAHDIGTVAVLFTTAIATMIAYFGYTIVYNVYLHPLSQFPGPPIARATTYWKAYIECIANRSFCHYLVELHAQYGM
jgi:hypothetical protein